MDRSVQVSEDVMVREGTRSDSNPSAPLPSLLSGGRSLPEPRGTCAVRAFSSQPQNSVSEYPNPRVPLVKVPDTLVHRHESLVLEMTRLYVRPILELRRRATMIGVLSLRRRRCLLDRSKKAWCLVYTCDMHSIGPPGDEYYICSFNLQRVRGATVAENWRQDGLR